LILISKIHEAVVKGPGAKKKKAKDDSSILWVNAEEEPAVEVIFCNFENYLFETALFMLRLVWRGSGRVFCTQ